eukprot:4926979-Ditylum_brightwellii.AAC.1
MSAWCPQTTKTGHPPNISLIEHKLKALGAEFKSVCCTVTGIMLEEHTVDEDEDEDEEDRNSNFPTKDIFHGCSWFASISTVKHMMELGHWFKDI